MPAFCSSCGAAIVWRETAAGKKMPLDAEPAADGNVVVNEDGTVAVLGQPDLYSAGRPRFRSHFSTCPQAARHRR